MEREKLEELAEKAGIELTHQLKEYLEALNSGTSDPSNFMHVRDRGKALQRQGKSQ